MRILRLRETMNKTGLKKTALYDMAREGGFPKPISIGPKMKGWLEEELDAWIADCVKESRKSEKGGVQQP